MEVPFFRPCLGDDEINEVVDCLRKGWLTTGPKTAAFEKAFADYLGGGVEAVAVNSATAGLHLALEAIGIGPGDEVIVPDYTFTATAEVVRYLGADPVFVDVDWDTMNMTPAAAAAAITGRTKAIMPVHFAGLPCDVSAFVELGKTRGVHIVEDSAHALPGRVGGALVGRHNTAATVFSFYANKTITTGEGGMLVTADPKIAARARTMRLHGFDRDAFSRFSGGSWRYDIVAPGYKYNMTDIAAALGLHQLKKADAFQKARSDLVARYKQALSDLPVDFQSDAAAGDLHAWHLFIIRLRPDCTVDRDTAFELLKARGVSCSVHYVPLHAFTYWRERYGLEAQHFPAADRAGRTALSLPLFVGMSDAEFDHVVASVRAVLAGS